MGKCTRDQTIAMSGLRQLLLMVIMVIPLLLSAQTKNNFWKKSDTLNTKRRSAVFLSEGVAASVALIGLNQLWYANYDRSGFHFFNDNNEWLQMDKAGHMLTSYYTGKIGMSLLDWAGESKKNQLIYGATLGFAFLTTIEVLDGFSSEWGFSAGDMVANASGTGLLIGQELLWDEQRILLKYSFHTTRYSDLRPDTFGKNLFEQALKDYNGQTYWLSVNIWSFNKQSKFPKWLNIAAGYGADNMLTGLSETPFDAPNYTTGKERYRQYYFSLDLDLTRIKTQSPFLKTVFSSLNFIKIPAPTIEFNPGGKPRFYWIYF